MSVYAKRSFSSFNFDSELNILRRL